MDRIKDLNKVKVRGDMLFCEIFQEKSKSGIILADDVQSVDTIDYMKVIAVGESIKDVEPGDVVVLADLKVNIMELDGKEYGIVARHLCAVIVNKDNFTFRKKGTKKIIN